jgi:hypothetical protein
MSGDLAAMRGQTIQINQKDIGRGFANFPEAGLLAVAKDFRSVAEIVRVRALAFASSAFQ